MAGTAEKEKREPRSASFTDGDYIPHSEAPNMPRVFSNADAAEDRGSGHRTVSVSMTVMLCALCLFCGMWLGSRRTVSEDTVPSAALRIAPEETLPQVTASVSAPARRESVSQERPVMGVAVQTVSAAAAEYYKLYCNDCIVQGVQVYSVGESSPAESAGIQPGDILMALDGEAVRSAEELSDAEGRYRPGEQAVCTLFREGKALELPVVFEEKRPSGERDAGGLDW